MSDIEGKAAKEAASERGKRASFNSKANRLTESIRLRIPKVASQAEAGEDGTHLIGRRTPRVLYNLSGSQESRKLNHVCKSFLVSWFPDERFDLVCDTFLDEQSLRQRRCRSSGAQRTYAIGVRTAAGSDQLHHRARSEAFARRTAKTSRAKHRQRACHRTRTNSGIGPCFRSSGRRV